MSDKKNYYYNRELSWMDFNARVLEEAQKKDNPLMERLRFLAITGSNLDEFFIKMVNSKKDLPHLRMPVITFIIPLSFRRVSCCR